MRRRMMPNLLGDYSKLEQRQSILERILQVIGFSPENPYTLFVNDGTRNTVLIGKIDGKYGIKTVNNVGATIIFADGHISADGITVGTLDADLVNIINLNADNITAGTISASRVVGGILDFDVVEAKDIRANKITVGTFPSPNNRFVNGSLSGVKITDGTLHANKIQAYTIKADHIYAGTITGDRLHFKTITADRIIDHSLGTGQMIYKGINADRIYATHLASLTSKTGTLYCGGSGGGDGQIYLRSAGGATIVRLWYGGIFSWEPIVTIGSKGFHSFDAAAVDFATYWNTEGGACYLYPDPSDTRLLFRGRTIQFYDSGGTNKLNFNKGASQIYDDSQLRIVTDDHLYLNAPSGIRPNGNIYFQDGEKSIYSIDWLEGYNDLRLKIEGGNKIGMWSTWGGGDLSFYPYWGDFYATGTKYFRIKHPDDPKNKFLQYTSIEAPEVALKIRGAAKLNSGEATIKPPHHWELATEHYLTTVQVTPLEDCNGLFVPKASLKNTSFVVKELQGGISNAEFMWELTATRKGYSDFDPEQTFEAEAQKIADGLVANNPHTKKEYEAIAKAKEDEHFRLIDRAKEIYKERTGKDWVNKIAKWREEDLKTQSDAVQTKREFQRAVSDEEHNRLSGVRRAAKQRALKFKEHVEEIDRLAKTYKDYDKAIREVNNIPEEEVPSGN